MVVHQLFCLKNPVTFFLVENHEMGWLENI
jgi:hypothetical protein